MTFPKKLAHVHTRTLVGIHAMPVVVEVHLGGGLPKVNIVGMAETAVKESRDRVRAAIRNSGFEFHTGRVVINLAPADMPKHGGRFDLPIALGILAASGQIPAESLRDLECIGELGLDGTLRSVAGVLPTALGMAITDRKLIVPEMNAQEAALCGEARILSAGSLREVCSSLCGETRLPRIISSVKLTDTLQLGDMSDVKGQYQVKRGLEIAAAGAHNMLLSGPPGTGKSMLAHRLSGILPLMTQMEAMETATVASVSNKGFVLSDWGKRPFRSPHHTASGVALVGGGSPPRPGEISLAHHGVLFLDELPEFSRSVLDVLREPMETGHITISRANWQSDFPARFQVMAAMNPCPCGYDGDPEIQCRCSPDQITRYQSRISGPFLDRIDLLMHVPRLNRSELRTLSADGESSEVIRARVEAARDVQFDRQGKFNAELGTKEMEEYCRLTDVIADLFDQISEKMKLSLRSHMRVIRLARTIADLDSVVDIEERHLMEAVSYRSNPIGQR